MQIKLHRFHGGSHGEAFGPAGSSTRFTNLMRSASICLVTDGGGS